jgi:hypothetical protein
MKCKRCNIKIKLKKSIQHRMGIVCYKKYLQELKQRNISNQLILFERYEK